MDCEDKRYIIEALPGIKGDQGEQGPPGPPGASVQLPIAASDVSVTNPGYANLQELLDDLLYTAIVINSFTNTVGVQEIGITITSITFNWALNKDPITQEITGPSITPPILVPADRTKVVAVSNLTGSAHGDSSTYVLSVVDEMAANPTSNSNITFYNGVYVGDAVIPGAIDSAFILTLNKQLKSNSSRTWTSTAGASEYAWFAARKDNGTVTFYVSGFPGGFEAPVTVSFTNSNGFTEDYYVWRSTNPQIGPVTIQAIN